jgi:hypothetical protein
MVSKRAPWSENSPGSGCHRPHSPPGLVGPSEVEAQPPHPAGPSSTGQVLTLTLVALNVLLAAEAEAGMEARAIPSATAAARQAPPPANVKNRGMTQPDWVW